MELHRSEPVGAVGPCNGPDVALAYRAVPKDNKGTRQQKSIAQASHPISQALRESVRACQTGTARACKMPSASRFLRCRQSAVRACFQVRSRVTPPQFAGQEVLQDARQWRYPRAARRRKFGKQIARAAVVNKLPCGFMLGDAHVRIVQRKQKAMVPVFAQRPHDVLSTTKSNT